MHHEKQGLEAQVTSMHERITLLGSAVSDAEAAKALLEAEVASFVKEREAVQALLATEDG